MKKTLLIISITYLLFAQEAIGQFTFKVPKLPKVEKPTREEPKPPQPKSEGTSTSDPSAYEPTYGSVRQF